MLTQRLAAFVAAALLIAGCGGTETVTPGGGAAAQPQQQQGRVAAPQGARRRIDVSALKPAANARGVRDASGALADGGFESGGFTAWKQCGSTGVNAVNETSVVHSGTHALQEGSTTSEPNGDAGVCQSVKVPVGGKIAYWEKQGTNETSTTYAYQEVDLLDANGYVLKTLFLGVSTNNWTQRTYDVSAYANQTVYLYFGVHGNPAAGYYIYQYIDDVAWAGSATPTPAPTATPTPGGTPTPKPSASPTPRPSVTPTTPPSGYPTPVPCDDAGFLNIQAQHPSGYTEVTVCGQVTQVLPEKTTSSGLHKYFYIQVAPGNTIEIVCNIDVMGEFAVKVGDQAVAHGRYYYDSATSQGIDWTHHNNAGASWPYPGYVQINGGPLYS
jgi:hypothetical protein